MQAEKCWRNATLLTMRGQGLGLVPQGVVAAGQGRIRYAGSEADAPRIDALETVNCEGRILTPGLIDCHTHLVFAGSRSGEWQARLSGARYEDIASTGGIRASVRATQAADEPALIAGALPRLDAMLEHGVTTIEVKSGYGLDPAVEQRCLLAAAALGRHRAISIVPTFLAAHAIPDGMSEAAFIDRVVEVTLPSVAARNLAAAVDGFLEGIAFGAASIRKLFTAATALNLPVKLHADQLSSGGGAELAASFNALSADHLEYTSEQGVAAMAAAGTTAVLLPGAFYVLREQQCPPVAALRAQGVPIALATDCNPGTSPLLSLPLAMHLGATLFGLTVEECWRGVTTNAARALGLADRGQLAPGLRADLAIWSIGSPADLVYWLGGRPLWRREVA